MSKSRSFRRSAMKLRTRFAGVSARVLGTLLAGAIVLASHDAGWWAARGWSSRVDLGSMPADERLSLEVPAPALARRQQRLVEDAVQRFGRIDVVVNNAAVFEPFAFVSGSDAVIRRHVDINLLGMCWLTRAAIPHLKATQGQIISVSSESVHMPFPMLALYAATKAAVEVLSEGLRAELRSDGIRVSVLRSGSVSGGSGGDSWSEEARTAFYQKIVQTGHAAMSGLPASPESMAQALVSVLALPRDVSVDLIELRAAQAGLPEGAHEVQS